MHCMIIVGERSKLVMSFEIRGLYAYIRNFGIVNRMRVHNAKMNGAYMHALYCFRSC